MIGKGQQRVGPVINVLLLLGFWTVAMLMCTFERNDFNLRKREEETSALFMR